VPPGSFLCCSVNDVGVIALEQTEERKNIAAEARFVDGA